MAHDYVVVKIVSRNYRAKKIRLTELVPLSSDDDYAEKLVQGMLLLGQDAVLKGPRMNPHLSLILQMEWKHLLGLPC